MLTGAEKDAAMSAMMNGPMDAFGKSQGMVDPKNEWTATDMPMIKEGNVTMYRMSQVYKGIKVHNGALTVRMNDAHQMDMASVHMNYVNGIQVDTNPKLTKQKAMQVGKKMLQDQINQLGGPAKDNSQGTPDKKMALTDPTAGDDANLEIHPGNGDGKRKLSWHVSMKDNAVNGPVQLEAWVDQDGNVLEAYNNVQPYVIGGYGYTGYQGLNGPGYGIGVFNLDYNSNNGGYVQNDNSYLIGVYDNYSTSGSTWQSNQCCSISFGNYSFGNRFTSSADVYVDTVQTLSFMIYVLGRDFVDGNRGPRIYTSVSGGNTLITARNHVNSNYNNAFWNGNSMNIGDGDGVNFSPLASLDIIGHEWQHGVTQYTAGLNYVNESGAINESMSDIMGSMTEKYWKGESANYLTSANSCTVAGSCNTWKLGEDAYTPGIAGDALRYMDEPWRGGQPWNYASRYTGASDNGGVHTNSGISNFAFFVLSRGWPGSGVSGIGPDAARWIFYHALRDCMIPTDGFYWTHQCTLYEAGVYYGFGGNVYNQTQAAWNFVGAP